MSVIHATCPSIPPPVCPAFSPSDHPSLSDHLYAILPSQSICPSPSDNWTKNKTCPSTPPLSHMTQCLHDSSQSLAVMKRELSHKDKKFCISFTKYDLLLCALDVSSIYTSVSRCVAPPKSWEDAHVTHGTEHVILVDLP